MAETAKLKQVLFISGDVGGARALLPVIEECEGQEIPFTVVAHGHMVHEAPARCPMVTLPAEPSGEVIAGLLAELGVGVLVFGSSVHDTLPLTVARHAREQRIPIVHLLDNWTGYRRRLEHDGLPLLLPDVYTVIDEVAYDGAIADGIDPTVLKITGHPALASLIRELAAAHSEDRMPSIPYRLLFVSEPVAADQGNDSNSPGFRGYTESQVLRLLCQALQPYANKVTLSILPHPREQVDQLRRTWEQASGQLQGTVITDGKGRQHVLQADGVAGMASLLLYEAWLDGKPVLSLQPDLKLKDLRMLARRKGVVFLDSADDIPRGVAAWVGRGRMDMNSEVQQAQQRHIRAAVDVVAITAGLLAGSDHVKD